MVKMVVFDLDNTLYDYDLCNHYAEQELYTVIGSLLHISKTEATDMLRKAKKNVKDRLGDVAASHNRLLYMQSICEQVGVKPGLYAMTFYNAYWNAVLGQMSLFPYVKPLFKQLDGRGIKIGLLTDLTAHIQYRKLDKLGLEEYIDIIVTSEEAGADKPSEKMFDLLIRKAGMKPHEIIMIGDSKEKDVDGAIRAGMRVIHYTRDIDVEAQLWRMIDDD